MVDGSYYEALMRGVFGGRKWLLALDVLAAAPARLRCIRGLGAERAFVLAGHRGLGDLPDPADAEWEVLGTSGDTMMASIRAAEAGFASPGAAVQARVDGWDPEREARVLGTMFSVGEPVCGRPFFGARPPEWQALEDKTVAESIWDAAGVERAPASVVAPSAAWGAAQALDRGQGTVWAGDMRDGFNGGAEYVHWVRDHASREQAERFFEVHCDRVRVMPFLDGIPCSIHGMVLGDAVLAFRPCEMVVLRSPDSSRFRYASAATFWEPSPADGASMRRAAKRVGTHLAERVGYRGAFTVDGVMTAEGFRPTELNPRVGAALMLLTSGIAGLQMDLLNAAVIEAPGLDWQPERLERMVIEASRVVRRASASVVVERVTDQPRAATVRFRQGRCEPVADGEVGDVTLSLGPHPVGGFLRIVLSSELTPVGPPVAERVAAALRWADEAWSLGVGPIEAAPDLRPAVG